MFSCADRYGYDESVQSMIVVKSSKALIERNTFEMYEKSHDTFLMHGDATFGHQIQGHVMGDLCTFSLTGGED